MPPADVLCRCPKCGPQGKKVCRTTKYTHKKAWESGTFQTIRQRKAARDMMEYEDNPEDAMIQFEGVAVRTPSQNPVASGSSARIPERNNDTLMEDDANHSGNGFEDLAFLEGPRVPSRAASPDEDLPHRNEVLDEVPGLPYEGLRLSADFVSAFQNASLESASSGLTESQIQRIRNPPQEERILSVFERLGVELFLATSGVSEQVYRDVRKAAMSAIEEVIRIPPNDLEFDVPTYEQCKRLVEDVTGVFPVYSDQCTNTCTAFVGPNSDLEICPICSEPRYDPVKLAKGKLVARQTFVTIPLGPQLQAMYRNATTAAHMEYRKKVTRYHAQAARNATAQGGEYNPEVLTDIFDGTEYIDAAVLDARIDDKSICVMFQWDGAQVLNDRHGSSWLWVWIILERAPNSRYRKISVLPGGSGKGPNNPKDHSAFIFPSLYHMSAIQHEGLIVWNAFLRTLYSARVYLFLATADGPAMADLTSGVGHHGKKHCRLFCGWIGRRPPNGTHYYPAALKPHDYEIEGCNHPDQDVRNLNVGSSDDYTLSLRLLFQSRNRATYQSMRLETGLTKQGILMGIPPEYRSPLPNIFGDEIMHLLCINMFDHLMKLWRGTLECYAPDDKATWDWAVLKGNTWTELGNSIERASRNLPPSISHCPRNLSKINSRYKAEEKKYVLYGLGVGELYRILPHPYFHSYCKLVAGARLIQNKVTTLDQMAQAHQFLCEFFEEYELLYYQRLPSRIHFVPPCLHGLLHLAPETVRLGPLSSSAAWSMETTVGNLKKEVRQQSNPYANLAERCVLRAQKNALHALYPQFLAGNPSANPNSTRRSHNLGDAYTLLHPREMRVHMLSDFELELLERFRHEFNLPEAELEYEGGVQRWGRLRLPNGQQARTAWKELERPPSKLRQSRCIKYIVEHITYYASIEWFTMLKTGDTSLCVALVHCFTQPNEDLLRYTSGTLLSIYAEVEDNNYQKLIPGKCIESVVGFVPFCDELEHLSGAFYVVEHIGTSSAGFEDIYEMEEEIGEENEREDEQDDDGAVLVISDDETFVFSIDKLRAASSNDVPTYLPELSPADYPLVTNWDENDKMDKARIPKNDDAYAPNRALFFLQKADGTTVTNREADHIRSVAFSVWDDLRMKPNPIPGSNGQAPDKWGQVSHVANAYFQRCMAASFPYLQYCSKNWKTTAVGTLNYSGWHTSRGLKTSEASRGQSAAPSERESSVAVTPAKRGASPGPDSSPSDKRQRLDPKTDAKGKGKLVKFAASKLNQRMQALGPAAFSLGRPASFTPPSSDALTASSEADAITPPFAPPIQYPRLPSLSGLTPPSCSSSTPPSTSAALASSANTGDDSSASNGFDSAAPSIASNSSLPTPSNLPATVPPVIDPALTGDDNVTAVHPPAPPALPPSPLPSTAAPPATEDFPVSAPDNAGPLEYFSPLTASMLPPWDEAATREELGDKADKGFRTKKKPSTFKEFVALQWQATDKKERGGVSLLLFERFFYELSSVQRAIYNDKYRLYRTAQK